MIYLFCFCCAKIYEKKKMSGLNQLMNEYMYIAIDSKANEYSKTVEFGNFLRDWVAQTRADQVTNRQHAFPCSETAFKHDCTKNISCQDNFSRSSAAVARTMISIAIS